MKKIVLLLFVLFIICSCSVQEPREVDYDIRFGVGGQVYPSDIDEGVDEIYDRTRELDKLGDIWLRHPGKGVSWYEVEPEKGEWDFRKLDAILDGSNHPWIFPTYGMVGQVYPFGGFSETELKSKSSKGGLIDYIVEHGLNMSIPEHKADAEVYVKMLVGRYKEDIKYWEVGGNEGLQDPTKFGIITNTYEWIKEADSSSTVLVTANCGDDDELFYNNIEALDEMMAKGLGEYFDIANFHYYGLVEGDFEERLEDRYSTYKQTLEKYGVYKPIWVTETCTSSYVKGLSGPSNEVRQARDVVKRLTIFSALGAEKVLWYGYGEHSEGDKFYGCSLLDGGEPKPAYYTFELMVEKLGYYDSVRTIKDDDIRLYEFVTGGDSVFVAWVVSGTQTVDFSDYVGEALVTYIVEESGVSEPEVEFVDDGIFELSESPIFIENI